MKPPLNASLVGSGLDGASLTEDSPPCILPFPGGPVSTAGMRDRCNGCGLNDPAPGEPLCRTCRRNAAHAAEASAVEADMADHARAELASEVVRKLGELGGELDFLFDVCTTLILSYPPASAPERLVRERELYRAVRAGVGKSIQEMQKGAP